jgi:hypothetical protein
MDDCKIPAPQFNNNFYNQLDLGYGYTLTPLGNNPNFYPEHYPKYIKDPNALDGHIGSTAKYTGLLIIAIIIIIVFVYLIVYIS